MTILTPSRACFDLIKRFESCAHKRADGTFEAYPDPGSGGDPWTVGWGSTGPDIHRGTVWTQDQCDARLALDVSRFADKVEKLIGGAPTTQHQFDAMCSLAYNIGAGNLASSTLLRMHKTGDHAAAAEQFHKWTRASGKVLPGLVKRRAAESLLYGTPDV